MENKKEKETKIDTKTYIHVKVDSIDSIGTYTIKNRVLSKTIEKLIDLDYFLRTGRNRKKFELELAEARKMFQSIGSAVKEEQPIVIDEELQKEFAETMEHIKAFNEAKEKEELLKELVETNKEEVESESK